MPIFIAHEKSLGLPVEVPVDLCKTRFLSLGEATIVLLRQLLAIMLTLDEAVTRASKKEVAIHASTLRSRLASPPFLICLCIESVLINILNLTNLTFQGRRLNFTSYRISLEKTIVQLEAQKNNNGPARFLQGQLSTTPLGKFYKLSDKDWENMGKKTTLFADALTLALKRRFPELDQLCDFDIFDTHNRQASES
jgi:hypothetical protein